MRAYRAVLKARFLALLQYRAAAVAGVSTQIFWGFIRIMILAAFYRSGAGGQPMSYDECVTYVWLGQGLIGILPFRPEPELQQMVRTGNVAYELVRPIDLYGLWYARAFAMRTAPTLLRVVPLYVFALLIGGMALPATPAGGLSFLLTLALAVVLASALTTIISTTLLWTISGVGISTLLAAGAWIFTGMILPLPLFPEWMQPLVEFLPFRGIMDLPFRLYMGNLPPSAVVGVVAQQVAWIAALVVFGRFLVARGRHRLVVQGG